MHQSRVVPIELSTGETIYAEVASTPGERDVAAMTLNFDSVVQSITAIARQLNDGIASVAPDKATIEFSLQLSTQSGRLAALLVQGEANATIKVGLEWKRGNINDE